MPADLNTALANRSHSSPSNKDSNSNKPSATVMNTVNLDTVDHDPVVKLINSLLIEEVRLGASDLHFEPYEKYYRVRFRIDGVLQQITTLLPHLIAKVSAYLKIKAQMDIMERRLPQDGRIQLKTADNNTFDYRANSLPTLFGEKIVLRIINVADSIVDIVSLGFELEQQQTFLTYSLTKPSGYGEGIFATHSARISHYLSPCHLH